MKNVFKVFGIISMVLIIGFSMAACGDGGDSDPDDFIISRSTTNVGIMGYIGAGGNVTIPAKIHKLPVTGIYNGAFQDNKTITSITIPNSVYIISESAFRGCTKLSSVTFQGTIISTNIATSSFPGDLRVKYLAGGIGTYTRPDGTSTTWTKQN